MPKSNDYDIRSGVTALLLKRGLARNQIRHEIPLDTYSSNGRCDIVVLLDNSITSIEIKSGSDTLKLLEKQCKAMRRFSDHVIPVLDSRHEEKSKGLFVYQCVWWHMGLNGPAFVRRSRQIEGPQWMEDKAASLTTQRWGRSDKTSVCDMVRVLWKNEAVAVSTRLGGPSAKRTTRDAAIKWISENASLKDLRPLVIEALKARVLNQWEERFWARFNADRGFVETLQPVETSPPVKRDLPLFEELQP